MSKRGLSVVIPSRAQPLQTQFLERAVASIRAQTVIEAFEIRILVAVDAGEVPTSDIGARLGLTFVESLGKYAVGALNTAIRQIDSELIAFLEDDDQWHPQYLQLAAETLAHGAFVSSTQLEHDENDLILRINDFPCPSGWLMPLPTFRLVGQLDETYRFHWDNEWLGRLAESGLPRLHLVESTAPIDPFLISQSRPWLGNVLQLGGPAVRLARHPSPYPLVRRLVHSNSGMKRIASIRELNDISMAELQTLGRRFGRTPW